MELKEICLQYKPPSRRAGDLPSFVFPRWSVRTPVPLSAVPEGARAGNGLWQPPSKRIVPPAARGASLSPTNDPNRVFYSELYGWGARGGARSPCPPHRGARGLQPTEDGVPRREKPRCVSPPPPSSAAVENPCPLREFRGKTERNPPPPPTPPPPMAFRPLPQRWSARGRSSHSDPRTRGSPGQGWGVTPVEEDRGAGHRWGLPPAGEQGWRPGTYRLELDLGPGPRGSSSGIGLPSGRLFCRPPRLPRPLPRGSRHPGGWWGVLGCGAGSGATHRSRSRIHAPGRGPEPRVPRLLQPTGQTLSLIHI